MELDPTIKISKTNFNLFFNAVKYIKLELLEINASQIHFDSDVYLLSQYRLKYYCIGRCNIYT